MEPKTFRPRLEALEDRLVPTAYTWTGADNNGEWADANNWSPNLPPGYPDGSGDDATLDGSQTIKYEGWTNGGVTHTVSGSIGKLLGAGSFTGTLLLPVSLDCFDSFTWYSGTIDFNSDDTHLTLRDGSDSNFWERGTIGQNGTADSTLTVTDGSTLNIEALETVYLGASLRVDGGTVLVEDSTVQWTGTGGLNTLVQNSGHLEFAGSGTDDPITRSFGPFDQVLSDKIELTSGTITFDPGASYVVTAGLLNSGTGTVSFLPNTNIDFPNAMSGETEWSYLQTSSDATTVLGQAGSANPAQVFCDQGFWMSEGSLMTKGTGSQKLTGGDEWHPVNINGGIVTIGAGLPAGSYGRLIIDGWGIVISGNAEVQIAIDTDSNTTSACDRIWAYNHFNIVGTGTKLTVQADGTNTASTRFKIPFLAGAGLFNGQFANTPGWVTLAHDNTDTWEYLNF